MPMYVRLYKFTEQGAREIKQAPERIQEAIKAAEALGSKPVVVLATMGRYDFVTVGEAPNDEVAATFAAALAAKGWLTTETLRAFTPEEFAALIAKLP